MLQIWLQRQKEYHIDEQQRTFFVSKNGTSLQKKVVTAKIRRYAELVGLHDHSSARLDKRFTPYCFRHWFTTWLRRNEICLGNILRCYEVILNGKLLTYMTTLIEKN